jgi:predicted dehydrogenase
MESNAMTPELDLSRRAFLAGGVVAGAAAVHARTHAQAAGANARLRIGIIGCGTIAQEHVDALLKLRQSDNIEVGAICDVNPDRAERLRAKWQAGGGGSAEVTQRYEDLLGRQDLDKILVAVPEHAHAYITLAALDAGKHVYVEKPVTHTIEEGQAVVRKTRETGLQVQVGVQGMADDSYSSAQRALRAGKIGPVVQAQIDYMRRYGPEGPFRKKEALPQAMPAGLDWETWLHPAPQIPWDPKRYHEWRCYRDYSGGIATDLFVHRITRLIRALNLSYPTRVVGMGGIYLWPDGRDMPDQFDMLAEYGPVEGITPGMTLQVLGAMANDRPNPHAIRGLKGTLIFTKDGWELRNEKGEVFETHKKTGGEDILLHHKNHHAAIRDGAPLNCPVELGLYGLVAVNMANESWFQRKMLAWDAQAERVVPA